jgi:hypothetical protein
VLALALVVLLLAGEQGPRVVVTSAYKVGTAPAYFRPVARVMDPGRALRCPSFTWDFGDGCVSSSEPWCDPYGALEDRPALWVFQPPKFHVYKRPGEYVIAFRVQSEDRTISDSVRVVVAGPEMVRRTP